MRKFIDLHIKWPFGGIDELKEMLRLAVKLEYGGVAVSSLSKIHGIPSQLKDWGLLHKIDLIDRIDLQPRSARELISMLKQVRRKFEIVAVNCPSKAVARQAAKDHRVDVLNFSTSVSTRKKVWFDRQEATLASGANCAYEINASDLIESEPTRSARLISIIRREIENAKRHDIPLIISSGADKPLLMRDPRGLAALLALADVDWEEGLNMVSIAPWTMVKLNREKLDSKFVSPGVKMVD
jgi:RNase P/RNase MRP subunit p30